MPLSVRLLLAIVPGTAAGVLADTSWIGVVGLLVASSGGFATLAHGHGWPRARNVTALAALAGAAWLLGAYAVERALHPPLRNLLESRIGGFAIESGTHGRLDDPIVIEGRLLRDAAPAGEGATIVLDVKRVWLSAQPGGESGVGSRESGVGRESQDPGVGSRESGVGRESRGEVASGGVSLTVGGVVSAARLDEWRAGRTVRLPVVLRRPARYFNAGVADGERALARRGVALVGTVKSGVLVEVTARGGWVDETAAAIRARVRAAVAAYLTPHDAQSGAVATAILIGDRTSLDPEEERRLQEAGTYHVIAISGGNIALLAALLLGALWAAGVRGPMAAGAAVTVLIAYAFIVGGGASVVRATAMAAVYLGLRTIDQRTSPLHAIALTAAGMLLVQPLEIADVGFWLTFGATAGIVAGAGRVAAARPGIAAGWKRAPVALCLASLCAELALMPMSALVFQRISLAGLLLNLAAVPSMALVQGAAAGTVAGAELGLPGLAGAAGRVTHFSAQALLGSARLVDFVPWTTWRVPSPGPLVVAAYYLSLIAWFLLSRPPIDRRGRRRLARLAGIVAAAAFLWIVVAPATLVRARGGGTLHVTVMDVGQGDALLVTLPSGRTMAVDGGGVSLRGDFDIGDRVLGPALRARGIGRLDYFVLTHPDPDHIGGAVSLVRDFRPHEVWAGVPVARHEASERLRAAAAAAGAGWRGLQRGDRLWDGGVEIRVRHPPPPEWERQRVRNDDSVVLELRFGEVSVLLTGDIEREAEQALAREIDLLPTVILKSPHHGSATSSSAEFLAAVKPSVVLISCGRGNPYGHPVKAVLDRYRDAGAAVFRTDLEGQLEVVTDGSRVAVSAFTGSRWQSH